MSALDDIAAERRRQVEAEGWTSEHDDQHDDGELATAAATYAYAAGADTLPAGEVPVDWPWEPSWWKPSTPRRMLVKSAALILAEIERLDRSHVDIQTHDGGR